MCEVKTLLCVHRVRWFSILYFTVCSQGHVALLTQFYCVFTEPEGSPYSNLLCSQSHVVLLTLFYCVNTESVCSQSRVVLPTLFYCVLTESVCSQSCGSPHSILLCVHRVGVFTVMWLSLLCFTVCSQKILQLFMRLCIHLERPSDAVPYLDNFLNSLKKGGASFKLEDVKPSRTRLDVAKVLVAKGDTSQARELLLLVTSMSHDRSQKEEVSICVRDNSFTLLHDHKKCISDVLAPSVIHVYMAHAE